MTRHAEPGRDPITARLMRTAREEADRARHGYVGCEHLLLALITDKDPTARDILAGRGISLPTARAAVADVVSSGAGDGPRWNATDLQSGCARPDSAGGPSGTVGSSALCTCRPHPCPDPATPRSPGVW
jgi:ClpA/ClpB-like protein